MSDDGLIFGSKAKVYKKPKPRRLRKASRPQSTENPDGEIGQPRRFSSRDDSTFNTLGVKAHLREETYLATFISCWLCVFVLPNDDLQVVRPSTFKVILFLASPLDANKHISPGFQTWWSKIHGKYLLEGCIALVGSVQSNPKHKKSRSKELVNIIDPSKGSDTQEIRRKSSQSSRDVGKISKDKDKRISSLEADIGKEALLENTSRCLSSIIVKGKQFNISGSNVKKRDNSHVDDDEHSNNSDQHWKRKKNKVMIYALDDNDLDPN
ncbi:hypothetical protein ACH5RR_001106 [Cinchona calisaya]|uniref:Uncharacterized protein n=1 Tax=Cinchona calisaya TaxID=153742 RepID=A0ABD3B309_9GENT